MGMSNKLEPGKMRHRIQIVAPSGVQDSFGGVSDKPADWKQVLKCWARIEAVSGFDRFAASTFVSALSHRVTIRYPRESATIGPNNQIWFEGRIFIIQAVLNPDETNKMLYLMCQEIVVNGAAAPNANTDR